VNEQEVFACLQKQKKAVLLDYLRDTYRQMTAEQRREVFAHAVRKPKAVVDADGLRHAIEQFRSDSLARKYYTPFNINSKNWMHRPEQTRAWCDLFGRFVADASLLTAWGEHAEAVACFAMLSDLVEALDSGREIIFAEEAGSWMIPRDKKAWLKAYLTSLAATAPPEAFTAAALPLLRRDSYQSFSGHVYAAALEVANPQQRAHLEAAVQQQKIRTGRTF
jgi:hypothetical protein